MSNTNAKPATITTTTTATTTTTTTTTGTDSSKSASSSSRRHRRRTQFLAWNSYLAKKEAAAAASIAVKRQDEIAVVKKLTIALIDTYEGINETYYRKLEEEKTKGDSKIVKHSGDGKNRDRKEKGKEKGKNGGRGNGEISGRKKKGKSLRSSSSSSGKREKGGGDVGSGGDGGSKSESGSRSSRNGLELANKYCDENYDYIVKKGELFNMRYVLERVIGKGSFGQVVQAYDTKTKEHVAIKIIKNSKPYFEQALSEVRMTAYLNRVDPNDEYGIMRLRDKFIFRGHQCLVLELLSFSLYDLLRSTQFYGVSLNLVRKFCKQIATCLSFLARPHIDIIHCDLKPENVLLRHPQRSIIKVIDFGSSCRVSEVLYTYVQSRFYRAPEVLLGFPYSTQIDVWSLGCMMVELHTGYPVFAGVDEVDQMHAIVERLGLPPKSMLDAGTKTSVFFNYDTALGEYKLVPSSNPKRDLTIVPGSKSIPLFIEEYTGAMMGKRKRESVGHGEADYDLFAELAHRMLDFNPVTRITAEQVLQHPYITGRILGAQKTGRDSPPPIPANAKIGDSVHLSLDPGRKAPVQRPSIPAEPPDAGGRLRPSRSDTAMATAASSSALASAGLSNEGGPLPSTCHWAEEVGIEPPAWRQKSAPNPFATSKPYAQTLFCAGKGTRLSRARQMPSRPPVPRRPAGQYRLKDSAVSTTLTQNTTMGRPKSMSALDKAKGMFLRENLGNRNMVMGRHSKQCRGRGHGVVTL